MTPNSNRKFIAPLTCLMLLLTACGGGGGGAKATLTISPSNLSFTANGPSAGTPAAQEIFGNVSGDLTGTLYVTIAGSGDAVGSVSEFVMTGETSGKVGVSPPSPGSLGVGSYSGSVVITACLNDPSCRTGQLSGSPQTVNVSYVVAGASASPDSLNYLVTNSATASDLTRQITVTTVPAQSWTARADRRWISVTPSGTNGSSLTVSLVQSEFNNLDNGRYTGNVTITPSTSGEALIVPVTLTLRRTQVSSISPYVAYVGTTDSVIIRGEEFQQASIRGILFGSTPATAFSVVSPTEIRATYPASLPRGSQKIALQSNFDGVRQIANLVVVDAPAFAATALSYPSSVNSVHVSALVYDAERAALGVSMWNNGPTNFVQFRSVANNWQAPTALPLNNNFALALSGDGSEWIMGSSRSVIHVRTSDLATTSTVTSPVDPTSTLNLTEFTPAGDGKIAMFGEASFGCGSPTIYVYDVRRRSFVNPEDTICRASAGASADGSLLLMMDEQTTFSSDDVFVLDPATGKRTTTGIRLLSGVNPVLDRTGSRIVLNRTSVYDRSFARLGRLPDSTVAVVLDPRGTTAYAYDDSGLLMTYDLTAATVNGLFPTKGSGRTLAGDPGREAALHSTAEVMMAITPDGRTVFIAGANGVIVQPVP